MDVVDETTANGLTPGSGGTEDESGLTNQVNDGVARCTWAEFVDKAGERVEAFAQGDEAVVNFEFELLSPVESEADRVFCASVSIRDSAEQVVHCRDALQYGKGTGRGMRAGQRIRCRQVLTLNLRPGNYQWTVALFSIPAHVYEAFQRREMTHYEYVTHQRVHASARGEAISIGFDRYGQLRHHGLVDLPGELEVEVTAGGDRPAAVEVPRKEPPREEVWTGPTVLHITHWKAGSQWLYKILRSIAPKRIVDARPDQAQVLVHPVRPGGVYPTLYITRGIYERTAMPADTRRVVILRDLRDTLVSGYFSLRNSHAVTDPSVAKFRSLLRDCTVDEGMVALLDDWLIWNARIHASWLGVGEPVLKYEDLLKDDVGLLLPVLRDQLGFTDVPEERIVAAIEDARFERLTGGRSRGTEDVSSHERKGVAGDWRNYFTKRLKDAFKLRYGTLLIEAGYERDFDW